MEGRVSFLFVVILSLHSSQSNKCRAVICTLNSNVGNCIVCTECNSTIIWSNFDSSITELYLNNCNINRIEYAHNLLSLEILDLSDNMLDYLPEGFLNNSRKLKHLYLEKNRLTSIPQSILKKTFENITIDCSCTLLNIVIKSSKWFRLATCGNTYISVKYKKCHADMTAVYIVTGLFLIIILCGSGLWWWRHSNTVNLADHHLACMRCNKKDHDDLPQSNTGVYMTNLEEIELQAPAPLYRMCTMEEITQEDYEPSHNYENVVIGPLICSEGNDEPEQEPYESICQSDLDEHVYGNCSYSYQCPFNSNQTEQEYDIYIIPS